MPLYLLYLVLITSVKGGRYYKHTSGLLTIPNITETWATEVYLYRNKITSIPSNALQHATNTWYLDLRYNSIANTSEEAFSGIPIQKLFLDYNPLTHFPYFPNINNTLTSLGLSYCKITNATWNLVVPYSNLEALNLGLNVIHHMPDLNRTKSRLQSLSLAGCGISAIQANYFDGFVSLKGLNLDSNKLMELGNFVFEGLSSLEGLSLSKNLFVKTEKSTFSGLSSLLNFVSTHGQLTQMPCFGTFSPKLSIFDVTANKIEHFPTNCTHFANTAQLKFSVNNLQDGNINSALKNLSKVTHFSFSKVGKLCLEFDTLNQLKQSIWIGITENKLKYIPIKNCGVTNIEADGRALDLPNLIELVLYKSELVQMPNISLLVNLRKLQLQNNNLTQLPQQSFAGNKKLQYIDISANLLTQPPDLSGGCTQLLTLKLSANNITNLPANYFRGCPVLATVYLNHNLFTALPSFTLIGNSLSTLYLQYNPISGMVSANSFFNLTALRNLQLEATQISGFDVSALKHTPSLYVLNLRRNNLLTEIGDPYRWCTGTTCKHSHIYVDYNANIRCDESRCWAKRYPTPIKSYFSGCFGKSWGSVTLDNLKCPGRNF